MRADSTGRTTRPVLEDISLSVGGVDRMYPCFFNGENCRTLDWVDQKRANPFSGPRFRFTVPVVRLIRARPHELRDIGLYMLVGSASGEEYLDTRPSDQDVELNQVL